MPNWTEIKLNNLCLLEWEFKTRISRSAILFGKTMRRLNQISRTYSFESTKISIWFDACKMWRLNQALEKLTLVCACVILKSLWQLSRSKVVLKPFWRFDDLNGRKNERTNGRTGKWPNKRHFETSALLNERKNEWTDKRRNHWQN